MIRTELMFLPCCVSGVHEDLTNVFTIVKQKRNDLNEKGVEIRLH